MAVCINSFGISGVDGYHVEVEVNTNFGQPGITIVGLGDKAVKEASERIKACLIYNGYEYPESRIVINLAPSSIKKYGSHYDLAMAIGLLVQTDQLMSNFVKPSGFIGELSLNGKIRGVSGVLPMVIKAKSIGLEYVIVSSENLKEAMLVEGIHIFAFEEFRGMIRFLTGKGGYDEPTFSDYNKMPDSKYGIDYCDVKGQDHVIRNAVVAAAGGHHMLMIGEPGCGKSMIAKRIPTILPRMNEEEALEVTKIQSVAGMLNDYNNLVVERPFRSPHHNASLNSLIGGGMRAMPGEVSLAHNGVLFLDEMAEFNRKTLDALRQPLEDKKVNISRVTASNSYPANFMLVAAINPCPCGYYGSSKCICTSGQVKRYRQKISGPIIDRIDIRQKVKPVPYIRISEMKASRSSAELRYYVEKARKIQLRRYKDVRGVNCNAQMQDRMITYFCELESDTEKFLKCIFDRNELSARSYNSLLRISRTFADMDGSRMIRMRDVKSSAFARGLKY